jgi:hypothetical protein
MPAQRAEDRALIARIASHTRWAETHDRSAATEPARKGLDARFAREIDPDGKLAPAELAVRIASARRAHFQRMALASARKRRKAS